MKTIDSVRRLTIAHLEKIGIANARVEAEHLLADALEMQRMDLFLQFERPLTDKEIEVCRQYLKERSERKPLAYIHGQIEFYNCTIQTRSCALIPRQETELLVDRIVSQLKNKDLKGKTLLDLCTGSGCIAIALKKALPDLQVTAVDISPEAIELAQLNADKNGAEVTFLCQDFYKGLTIGPFDYFVSNPPYVTDLEWSGLEREVKDYEPRLALTSGPTGLEFYREIAAQIQDIVKPEGAIWMEMGRGQGAGVAKLMTEAKCTGVEVTADLSGHDRYFHALFS